MYVWYMHVLYVYGVCVCGVMSGMCVVCGMCVCMVCVWACQHCDCRSPLCHFTVSKDRIKTMSAQREVPGDRTRQGLPETGVLLLQEAPGGDLETPSGGPHSRWSKAEPHRASLSSIFCL